MSLQTDNESVLGEGEWMIDLRGFGEKHVKLVFDKNPWWSPFFLLLSFSYKTPGCGLENRLRSFLKILKERRYIVSTHGTNQLTLITLLQYLIILKIFANEKYKMF
jgi:hypothetical protein